MNGWQLRYETWDPDRQPLREALCTLGNGHFATRGAFEESRGGGPHYPGTYVAGGYDRIATEVRGELLVNEDLVNWPNWLYLTFRPEGGEWLSLDRFAVESFEQVLDLAEGVLSRRVRFTDRDGRTSQLTTRRIVSMDDPHVAALEWELTPLDWSGAVTLRSGLDGAVDNSGVERYRELRGDHLVRRGTGQAEDGALWITVETHQSRIRMAQACHTRVQGAVTDRRLIHEPDRIFEDVDLAVEAGRPLRVEKRVALHSSRELAASEPLHDALRNLRLAGDFATLLEAHRRQWRHLWRRCDIRLDQANLGVDCILRLHMFHLLQVTSPHVVDRDVGVPARGLHGEAYRGHVFWDELFIFPFLTYRLPDLTRELLMYRYRRLPAARLIARRQGFEGALYPWQSGSTGREESQVLHLNPRSGRWIPDETHLQRHIDAAVAYNVWVYYEVTEDRSFLSHFGAEMVLEIARFWASITEWDADLGRWRIRGVVGPDEYQTRNPGSDRPGIDDNAYTNLMAAWCLRLPDRVLGLLDTARRDELLEDLGLDDRDLARWREIASRLHVPFLGEHIIAQFEGYAELEEFDWEGYRARYGDIQRLDRLLESEGDTTNRYKASKQADVLMLFYLFTADELTALVRSMGYEFEAEWIPENVDYYLDRTSHGSTLSRVVHSWVLSRTDRPGSWDLFEQALRSDVEDIQGGTTSEGIHLGAMAGTVDLLQRGYLGAGIRDGVLHLEPRLPENLACLDTRLHVLGGWIAIAVDQSGVEVTYETGWRPEAKVRVNGELHTLGIGDRRRFPLPPGRGRTRPEHPGLEQT